MRSTPQTILPAVVGRPRSALFDWFQHHPILLFFALTFLFSWSIYAALSCISFTNETTYQRILGIAGFGPALSAMLLSRIKRVENRRQNAPRKFSVARSLFFPLLTFLLVAGVEWWNNRWWDHAYDTSLILVDAVLIFLASIVIRWLFSRDAEPGCRLLGLALGRAFYLWVLVALACWPVLVVVGNAIAGVFGTPLPSDPIWPEKPLIPVVFQSVLWALLFGGPLNEEPGWRGFALPRLQRSFSPLVASIMIGILWGLWHIPLHFMGAYGGEPFGAIIRIQEIPRAVLFTWLYNRSKGSLLVVLLLHASINTTGWFLPRSYAIVLILCTLLAFILVIKDRMWEKGAVAG